METSVRHLWQVSFSPLSPDIITTQHNFSILNLSHSSSPLHCHHHIQSSSRLLFLSLETHDWDISLFLALPPLDFTKICIRVTFHRNIFSNLLILIRKQMQWRLVSPWTRPGGQWRHGTHLTPWCLVHLSLCMMLGAGFEGKDHIGCRVKPDAKGLKAECCSGSSLSPALSSLKQ